MEGTNEAPRLSIVDQLRTIDAVLQDHTMTIAQRAIVADVVRSANGVTGLCWPAYRALRERLGVSVSTVRKALESAAGRYIERVATGPRGAAGYAVIIATKQPRTRMNGTISASPSEAPQRIAQRGAETQKRFAPAPQRFAQRNHTGSYTDSNIDVGVAPATDQKPRSDNAWVDRWIDSIGEAMRASDLERALNRRPWAAALHEIYRTDAEHCEHWADMIFMTAREVCQSEADNRFALLQSRIDEMISDLRCPKGPVSVSQRESNNDSG